MLFIYAHKVGKLDRGSGQKTLLHEQHHNKPKISYPSLITEKTTLPVTNGFSHIIFPLKG